MFNRPLSFTALAIILASASAHADPVTYSLSGTFSGSLGSQTFTNTSGTIKFVGTTAGITDHGFGYFTDTAGISTIALAGIGSATFLSPGFGAESELNAAGFFDFVTDFGTTIYDPFLGGYDLHSPFTDTAFLQTSSATQFGMMEPTSLGELTLSGDLNSAATFTAVSTTPEPGSLILLGTGALGTCTTLLRRVRARRAPAPS